MGRHGYIDDFDTEDRNAYAMWRGRISSAIRGKRGQRFLKELRASLDAMPDKRLVAGDIVNEHGCCAIGSACIARKLPDIDELDPEDHESLAAIFDVAPCLIQEIEYVNDEYTYANDAEKRWHTVRKWVEKNIIENPPPQGAAHAE